MIFYQWNLLNSEVAIYLAWSRVLFSASPIYLLGTVVIDKPLVSGILFSTSRIFVTRTVAVTKP